MTILAENKTVDYRSLSSCKSPLVFLGRLMFHSEFLGLIHVSRSSVNLFSSSASNLYGLPCTSVGRHKHVKRRYNSCKKKRKVIMYMNEEATGQSNFPRYKIHIILFYHRKLPKIRTKNITPSKC